MTTRKRDSLPPNVSNQIPINWSDFGAAGTFTALWVGVVNLLGFELSACTRKNNLGGVHGPFGTEMRWRAARRTRTRGFTVAAQFADLCTARVSDRSPVPFTSAAAAFSHRSVKALGFWDVVFAFQLERDCLKEEPVLPLFKPLMRHRLGFLPVWLSNFN